LRERNGVGIAVGLEPRDDFVMGNRSAIRDVLYALEDFVDFLAGVLDELIESDLVELFDAATGVSRQYLELREKFVVHFNL
jgi:hypothetical protein